MTVPRQQRAMKKARKLMEGLPTDPSPLLAWLHRVDGTRGWEARHRYLHQKYAWMVREDTCTLGGWAALPDKLCDGDLEVAQAWTELHGSQRVPLTLLLELENRKVLTLNDDTGHVKLTSRGVKVVQALSLDVLAALLD